jgi:hypothetical protein
MVWTVIAAVLTIMVLSRIAGDNPVFRFTQYLFVGVSLGFSVLVLWSQLALFWQPAIAGEAATSQVLTLAPVVLGLLLFTRLGSQRVSWLANLPLGLIFGVTAALAIGGTLLGTLIPQLRAQIVPAQAPAALADQVGRLVLLLGIMLILLSFQYTGKRSASPSPLGQGATSAGRWLLIGSLGVFFAGAMLTYLTVLVDRVRFLVTLF